MILRSNCDEVSSAANPDADDMSRPGSDDYVRLDKWIFGELCDWAIDLDMDGMATPASVHKTWVMGYCTGNGLTLLFSLSYPRCAGVDVFESKRQEDVNIQTRMLRFLFSTHKHMVGCCCSISTNAGQGQWWCFRIESTLGFPRLASATVQSERLSALGETSPFSYWKNPKTSWRYMRLMEVVAPGSGGSGMVEGITEDQYRQLNEFPLSEQTRSLAAFSGRPLL